jgi:hypothetical protein
MIFLRMQNINQLATNYAIPRGSNMAAAAAPAVTAAAQNTTAISTDQPRNYFVSHAWFHLLAWARTLFHLRMKLKTCSCIS